MFKILLKNKEFKKVEYDSRLDEYIVYLDDGYGSYLRFYGKDIRENNIKADYIDGCKLFGPIFEIEKAVIDIEKDGDTIYLLEAKIIKSL